MNGIYSLKNMIEHINLIEKYGGINQAKNVLKLLKLSEEIGLFHGILKINTSEEIKKLQKSIIEMDK